MKTTGSLIGGRLIDDDRIYTAYANYLVKFVQAYEAEGVPIYGLTTASDQTRFVYCKDANRCGSYENTSFTFLGFDFRVRATRSKHGVTFPCFLPAASKAALKKMSTEVRRWRIHRRTGRRKYKRLAGFNKAKHCFQGITQRYPRMLCTGDGHASSGDQDGKSRVTGD